MENKVTKFGLRKMLAVLAGAFACVCMWGCGNDVTMHWSEERSIGKVVGFVNDSLAIVNTSRYWHEEVEPTFGLSYDYSGYAHPGLSLYNYRVQLDGPVWSDTLDNSRDDDFNYIRGQLSDSVIWGGDPKSEVSFWKIGEKPHKMKIKKLFDGCSIEVHYTTKLRPWFDRKILVMGERNVPPDVKGFDLDSLGDEYCQYGVLDTIKKTLTYKRLDSDLRWIRKCDDVRAWGKDVYCLYYEASSANVYLKIENKMKDSILVDNQGWNSGVFFLGKMILVDGNLCEYKDAWVCYPRQGILKMGFHADNGIILQF